MTSDDNDEGLDDFAPPTDPGLRAVQDIQFGGPEDGAKSLRALVDDQVARREHGMRAQADVQRAKHSLEDFVARNRELANDPMASAAIEAKVYQLQIEDLRKVGADLAKAEAAAGRKLTPADIANWHQSLRIAGSPIRTPDRLLEEAIEGYANWQPPQARRRKISDPIGDRQRATRRLRGLPPPTVNERSENAEENLQPSIEQQASMRVFGDGDGSIEETGRSRGAEQMRLARLRGRGRVAEPFDSGRFTPARGGDLGGAGSDGDFVGAGSDGGDNS